MLITYDYMFSFIWDLLTLSLFRKSEIRKSRDYRRKNSVHRTEYTIMMDVFSIFLEATFSWKKSEKPLFEKRQNKNMRKGH